MLQLDVIKKWNVECRLNPSSSDKKNLQCYQWDSTNLVWWEFATPTDNGVWSFIEGVKMPGVGIWFTTIWGDSGDPGNYSLLLVRIPHF